MIQFDVPPIISIRGDQGTGKTTLAIRLAIECHKRFGGNGIVVADNERAAQFCQQMVIDEIGQELHIRQLGEPNPKTGELTKAPIDHMVDIFRKAQAGHASCLVIDSLTDLLKTPRIQYVNRTNKAPDGGDYMLIDKGFNDFVRKLPYAQIPIIFTGRTKLVKKKGSEGHEVFDGKDAEYYSTLNIITSRKGAQFKVECAKDRTTAVDGQTFKNANASDFAPFFERFSFKSGKEGAA